MHLLMIRLSKMLWKTGVIMGLKKSDPLGSKVTATQQPDKHVQSVGQPSASFTEPTHQLYHPVWRKRHDSDSMKMIMEKDQREVFNRTVQSWITASRSLHINVTTPFTASVADRTIECLAFLPDFGSPNGMLVGVMFNPGFAAVALPRFGGQVHLSSPVVRRRSVQRVAHP